MKNPAKNKFPYTPFNAYCIRTPLLPIEFYNKLTTSYQASDTELFEYLGIPVVTEAIYLASPELYVQLKKWGTGEIKDQKKVKRLRLALLKYLTRMSTRCTPFGLFAAVGTGVLGGETQIELKSYAELQKKTHYDMHFLVAYANDLIDKPHIKSQLLFYPNSSIYKIGKRYRYVEYQYENKRRVYSLESVAHSVYLENILNTSKSGTTIDVLATLLENMDIEPEEAISFIHELIDNQILVSELEPSITGIGFLEDIKNRLESLTKVDKELKQLEKLQFYISKLDQQIGNPIKDYLPINKLISEMKIPFEQKYLLQTDTFSSFTSNTLSYNTIKKVKQGIAFLNKISKFEKNKNLEHFKKEFIGRYENTRVSLLRVMDVENGIGYIQNSNSLEATPFLDDIIYPFQGLKKGNATNDNMLQPVLIKKLSQALATNASQIELSYDDFPDYAYKWENAPDTLSVMTEIVMEDGKEKIVMNYCTGNATKLLGRFGHGSNAIDNLLEKITKKEAEINPNCIMAEIIHLPESRTGNILRRPQLRGFEIPYLGKSNMPVAQQIKLEDIVVALEDDTIKLYMKDDGAQILPRLSNAHNYNATTLPAYHFLCDLQSQHQGDFDFSWGSAFSGYPFLPRVIYNDCILSKAQWSLTKKDVETLSISFENGQNTHKVIEVWRKKYHIPKMVQLVDGDNTLPINFNNRNSVEMFLNTINNRTTFVLEEFLNVGESVVKCALQNYCNQFVFAFYNHKKLHDVRDS